MSIVSYAQNFEDIILFRALKNVENGFYIDVGANDPVEDSVTNLFYDKGWHGINIEPLAEHISDLNIHRKKDNNLQCIVGAEKGVVDFWGFGVRGLATASLAVKEMHEKNGLESQWHQVPMVTLTSICDDHVREAIHFLKIDVEGYECEVLLGADFSKYRPWIVIVEATKPNSRSKTVSEWEHLIVEHDYDRVYDDGLNLFYLAREHAELKPAFAYPPSIFDDFITAQSLKYITQSRESDANIERIKKILEATECKMIEIKSRQEIVNSFNERNLDLLEAQIRRIGDELSAALAQSEYYFSELEKSNAELALILQCNHDHFLSSERYRKEINLFHKSTFWQLTWPLRKITDFLKWVFLFIYTKLTFIPLLSKASASRLLKSLFGFFITNKKFKNKVVIFLKKNKKIDSMIRNWAVNKGFDVKVKKNIDDKICSKNLVPMSIEARKIYSRLENIFDLKENGDAE